MNIRAMPPRLTSATHEPGVDADYYFRQSLVNGDVPFSPEARR